MHLSKLVRALQRAGLVARAGNPADTRAVQLSVTDRGVRVVTVARTTVLQLEEQRLAPWAGATANKAPSCGRRCWSCCATARPCAPRTMTASRRQPAPTARGPNQTSQ